MSESPRGYERIECHLCHFKITKRQFNSHIKTCNGIGPKTEHLKIKGRGQGWARGKTLSEIHGIEKASKLIEKLRTNKIVWNHTTETNRRKKISNSMIGNTNWENSISKSGKGKKGNYKGYYFASSWELAFIIFCLDHGIKFQRNWSKFEYINSKNEKKYYVPDFLIDDCFYEVKGFITNDVYLKIKHFPHKIILLTEEHIKPMLAYVKKTYGKDYLLRQSTQEV